MSTKPMKLLFFALKVLLAAFAASIGMVILLTVVGLVAGSEMLLEPSTNRVVMIVTMLLAIPICARYLKK
jgi:hypothetical protein